MSRKKPIDKTQIRERRNRMLESAAAARLSLTEGVREMRAISGMTQEDFARHRGVSSRVIKAIELGQGNPTMATLNRIGRFFGLEVAFVPIAREAQDGASVQPSDGAAAPAGDADVSPAELIARAMNERNRAAVLVQEMQERFARLDADMDEAIQRLAAADLPGEPSASSGTAGQALPERAAAGKRRSRTGKKLGAI